MESEFIKQLNYEIEIQKTINNNPRLFIKNRCIILHKFKKKLHLLEENDLPTQTLLGSVFLINGKNIIECYSYCDYNYSFYIQINRKQPMWIGRLNIINKSDKYPEHMEYLLEESNIYRPSNYQYLLLQFIQSGFSLYVK